MGIARVDQAPSLAGRVDPTLHRPVPPAYGTTVTQPAPPTPTPAPVPPAPWAGPLAQPLPDLVTLGGPAVPAPTDGVVRTNPPKPPKPPPPQPPPGALSGLVKKAYAGKSATELAASPVGALKGVSAADAAALATAFGVHTVRDLATNTQVRAALTITEAAGS
jgi:hypothetical protein